MDSKSEWMEFYHRTLGLGQASGAPPPPPTGRVSDATIVTTAMTASNFTSPQRNTIAAGSPIVSSSTYTNTNNNSHLGAEGRVAKVTRKRTRVSKRAPTTLLNTDTHNFRAMVQQFTGGPSAHLFTGFQGGSNLNFGYGSHHPYQVHDPLAAALTPLTHPNLQQQQEELVFLSSGSSGNVAATAGGGGGSSNNGSSQLFLEGFTNPRPNLDGFMFDGVSSNMQPKSTSFQRW